MQILFVFVLIIGCMVYLPKLENGSNGFDIISYIPYLGYWKNNVNEYTGVCVSSIIYKGKTAVLLMHQDEWGDFIHYSEYVGFPIYSVVDRGYDKLVKEFEGCHDGFIQGKTYWVKYHEELYSTGGFGIDTRTILLDYKEVG